MTLAFDGTNYWSSSGGSPGGTRLARYNSSGSLSGAFAPGLDFRSVFTNSAGDVFARAYNDSTIYEQNTPGSFSPSGVTLAANSLDVQSSVVLNGPNSEFIAQSGGVVRRWDLSGNALSSTSLIGFGSIAGENNYPASRGVAAVGNYWLTYSSGILSAWNSSGIRVDQTQLLLAGTGFDSNFSLSYANGRVFIVDSAGGNWRGYDVGLSQTSPVPEPGSIAMWGISALGMMFARRKRRQLLMAA